MPMAVSSCVICSSNSDGRTAAALWNATTQPGPRNEPDVLDAFEFLAGSDALMEFAVARTAFGTDAAPRWAVALGDAAQLGIEAETPWDPERLVLTPAFAPYQTGAAYWRLTDIPEGLAVTLEVVGAGVSWGLLATDTSGADWVVDDTLSWVGSGADLVVGVVNLGEPGFDGDDAWTQSDFTLHVMAAEPDLDTDADTSGLDDSADAGCACGSSGKSNPALLLLLLGWWRRRPTSPAP